MRKLFYFALAVIFPLPLSMAIGAPPNFYFGLCIVNVLGLIYYEMK